MNCLSTTFFAGSNMSKETSKEVIQYEPYMFGSNFSFSDSTAELTSALIKVKEELGDVIPYDSKNPHFKNRFASLEMTLTKVNPVLLKNGLVLTQWPS